MDFWRIAVLIAIVSVLVGALVGVRFKLFAILIPVFLVLLWSDSVAQSFTKMIN
jgi:hypothetical protein